MNRLMSTEPPELPWQAESDSDTTLHVLYRFFDASGNLLYVGITCNPSGRFSDHRTKNWWRDVANITLEHADSRNELEQLEIAAIQSENPRYNIIRHYPRTEIGRELAAVAAELQLAHRAQMIRHDHLAYAPPPE